MSLTNLTLKAAVDGLAAGEFTSIELTKAHIEAIEAARGLNAYILETPEQALDMLAAFRPPEVARWIVSPAQT